MAVQDRRSSIGVKVQYGTYTVAAESGEKTPALVDKALDNVSDIPDLGGAPEQIDVTAIGDDRRKFIAGIIEQDELEFTCWYEKEIFNTLKDLAKPANGGHMLKITIFHKDASGKEVAEVEVNVYGTISVSLAGFGVGDAITYTMRMSVEDLKISKPAAA